MDKKELKLILEEGESEKVEFKPSLSQMDAIVQAVVGFANLRGGMILIGVSDGGKVLGCEIGKGSVENLANIINQKTEPKVHPEIFIEVIEGKKIIVVGVCESIDKPVLAFGKLYKRIGKSTVLCSRNEFEKLVLEKHKKKILFDSQICEGARLDDINKKTVDNFVKLAEDSKRLTGNDSIKILIEKLGLSQDGKLKNSAILLFGKEPKKFFRNNIIKCGRFKGEDKEEFIDLKDFEGNLFENLESCISFLKEHLRISAKIEGLVRKEKWEIPLEAFREALINAMIHRDYNVAGFIYIKIYDSKIIISNPGQLPVELEIKDLYKEHESFPRNPLLAETFYYTGLIDVWGRGSLNILRLLNENGLDKPIFEQSGGYFRIIFNRSENVPENVPEKRRELILEFISKDNKITIPELAIKINVNEKTIKRDIDNLRENNLLKRVGADKGGHWEIIK